MPPKFFVHHESGHKTLYVRDSNGEFVSNISFPRDTKVRVVNMTSDLGKRLNGCLATVNSFDRAEWVYDLSLEPCEVAPTGAKLLIGPDNVEPEGSGGNEDDQWTELEAAMERLRTQESPSTDATEAEEVAPRAKGLVEQRPPSLSHVHAPAVSAAAGSVYVSYRKNRAHKERAREEAIARERKLLEEGASAVEAERRQAAADLEAARLALEEARAAASRAREAAARSDAPAGTPPDEPQTPPEEPPAEPAEPAASPAERARAELERLRLLREAREASQQPLQPPSTVMRTIEETLSAWFNGSEKEPKEPQKPEVEALQQRLPPLPSSPALPSATGRPSATERPADATAVPNSLADNVFARLNAPLSAGVIKAGKLEEDPSLSAKAPKLKEMVLEPVELSLSDQPNAEEELLQQQLQYQQEQWLRQQEEQRKLEEQRLHDQRRLEEQQRLEKQRQDEEQLRRREQEQRRRELEEQWTRQQHEWEEQKRQMKEQQQREQQRNLRELEEQRQAWEEQKQREAELKRQEEEQREEEQRERQQPGEMVYAPPSWDLPPAQQVRLVAPLVAPNSTTMVVSDLQSGALAARPMEPVKLEGIGEMKFLAPRVADSVAAPPLVPERSLERPAGLASQAASSLVAKPLAPPPAALWEPAVPPRTAPQAPSEAKPRSVSPAPQSSGAVLRPPSTAPGGPGRSASPSKRGRYVESRVLA